jgi:hypothetical protein
MFRTDTLPKPETLITSLEELTKKVLLKMKPEDKAQLIEVLSYVGKTPCNYEELGIKADTYIKAIPTTYSTPGWGGAIPAGVALLDLFARDPSELAVLVTLKEDDLVKFTRSMYNTYVEKHFAKCGPIWNIHQLTAGIAKLRLGGI